MGIWWKQEVDEDRGEGEREGRERRGEERKGRSSTGMVSPHIKPVFVSVTSIEGFRLEVVGCCDIICSLAKGGRGNGDSESWSQDR